MTPEAYETALTTTWPAAQVRAMGPFMLRNGAGGGRRVSAATCEGPWTDAALDAAIHAQTQTGAVFRVRHGETALDEALASRGFERADPTLCYAAPACALAVPVPPVTAWCVWEPLAIMDEIWESGGIDAPRRAVMTRAACPKTAILGRTADTAAGAAFVGAAAGIAMIHAIEVRPAYRRRGLGGAMIAAAAHWARAQGCKTLGLLVTEANAPARALYTRLQLKVIGGYHYRVFPVVPNARECPA